MTVRLSLFGGLMMLLGLALRIAGAGGDLWLDEITSIRNAAGIQSAGAVFWGINSDNNHFLNSLYLYAIGPDHGALAFRAFAILQGTLAIPVAGLVAGGMRRPVFAALAMVLFAVSYPMVHFGSEARGYAGLILFGLLALLFIRRPDSFNNRIGLGVAILLGCLSHFLMAPFVVALVIAEFGVAYRRSSSARDAFRQTFALFLIPAILVGFCALFILGHMPRATLSVGDPDASPLRDTTAGYGIGLEMLAGWYSPYVSQVFIAGAFLLFWTYRKRFDERTRVLYLLVVFAIPLAVFGASLFVKTLSNFSNPRYYIPSVSLALLMLAECLSCGLAGSRRIRRMTVCLLACILIGNTVNLARFYAKGRGHYAQAVRDMTAHGPAAYGLRVPFGVGTVVDYYAKREGVSLTQVPMEKWCETPPDWWVLGSNPLAPFPQETIRGPEACPVTFDTPVIYSFWGLSGWEWTIYKRRAG